MKAAEWSMVRLFTLAAQQGRCANTPTCSTPALDVVARGVGDYQAFCRSCRLKHDAPVRVEKCRRTKRRHFEERTGQASIPGTTS